MHAENQVVGEKRDAATGGDYNASGEKEKMDSVGAEKLRSR
jgi:hypothetical protein